MAKDIDIITKLMKLTPTGFENLVFDLMILSGLRNVTWRTPGVDGGRDIEGYWATNDFTETLKLERWYIECKRYAQSIDWPTLYRKIAYADNHNADFLLIVTTSYISPKCKDEITTWENNRKRPFIRYWDGTTIENQLKRHPVLLIKYSIIGEKQYEGKEFLPTINIALKTVNSAYSKAMFNDTLTPELELCAALVDLVFARIEENKHPNGNLQKRFLIDRDLYDWCKIDGDADLSLLDSFGMRALLAAIRFCGPKNKTVMYLRQSRRLENVNRSKRLKTCTT